LQACPYDALYIDPESNTAAKCNFCTHRLEAGLEPSCVVVCPEQAIIAGDMDDPTTEISKLLDRFPVQVRKPEKGTKPKLFYIEADQASLVPTRTPAGGRSMWSRGEFTTTDNKPAEVNGTKRLSLATVATYELPDPRRAYDVRPRAPAWGWEVVAYTWTKSIATGSFLAVFAAQSLTGSTVADRIGLAMGLVSLVFLILTAGLLIADLKQPKRFLYVLLRPQWRSWLVRGAYAITGYGAILTLWLIAKLIDAQSMANILLWPGAILAVVSAVYTALLFAQAKGRDFWQNPLLCVHLLAHALLAGSAMWVMIDTFQLSQPTDAARLSLMGTLVFSVIALFAEILTTPPTTDAHIAMKWIIRKPMGQWFWGEGLCMGHLLPFFLLASGVPSLCIMAAILALAGLYVIEWLWVQAPQQVPLS